VVTADGERAVADDDLLFALRGGGGRGVVATSLTVRLHAPDGLFGGMVAWPADRAEEVLEQTRRLALDAPECLSLVFRVINIPGNAMAMVVAVHQGPRADGERLLAPLRATGGALADTFDAIGPADLPRLAGDPEEPGAARGEGLLLADLTPDAVTTIAEATRTAPLGVFEVRQLGGALAREPEPAHAGGALGALDAPFSFFAGGLADTPEATAAVEAARADVHARLAPHAADRVLLSNSGLGADPARGYAPGVYDRLAAIRRRLDPDRLFLSHHDG
jgi:hypothetical protein